MKLKDDHTGFNISEQEINQTLCRLITLMRINKSRKAKRYKKVLEEIEQSIANHKL